jgi:glucosamine kinase
MHVVGIDGGGTRTRAVLMDSTGRICSWALGGSGNFQAIGLSGLGHLLEELLAALEWKGGGDSLSLCMGLAGAGRVDEQEEIAGMVRARGWAGRVSVVSDARAALEGAHGGRPGLIAISGTGSIVLGKNRVGEERRAGGWGPLLGDEGSGYCIGLDGLRAVFRARDGWGEETQLTEDLRKELGIAHWDEAVRQVYSGAWGRDRIAALSPRIFAAVRDGDEVAREVIATAGTALGGKVGAVARRLDLRGAVDLACVGGVFAREAELLWPYMEAAVSGGVESLSRCIPRLPPVLGATLLARLLAGYGVDEELVERLATDCPKGL